MVFYAIPLVKDLDWYDEEARDLSRASSSLQVKNDYSIYNDDSDDENDQCYENPWQVEFDRGVNIYSHRTGATRMIFDLMFFT
jgi:hypothetical protein